MRLKKRWLHPTPPQLITVSFAAMILVGALLLNLPIASQNRQSVGFLNALFTATSANCVTGLVVVNTMAQWTLFGKVVILTLIQLGGLGFISVLMLNVLLLRKRISLRNRLVIQASFNQDSPAGMVRLLKTVFKVTFITEGVGAVLLTGLFFFTDAAGFLNALGKGVFHAVSAFCNAGFDIVGADSLGPYRANLAINLVIMFLIIAGGLGFPVWGELVQTVKNPNQRSWKFRRSHWSLQTKIVLLMTVVLVAGGLVMFLLLEWNNPETLGPLGAGEKVLAALFQSVTLRTAGFTSISQAGLTEISKIVSSILMLIGGSPAGTAGGMKTITIAVILISMYSVLQGRSKMEVFGRSLPLELLQKALTVVSTLLLVVFIATLILHFSEQNSVFEHTVLDLIYETSSAAGTVGLTTGITPYLSSIGKLVIVFCMFLGRLGPITVVVALNMRLHADDDNLDYPEERVIIG